MINMDAAQLRQIVMNLCVNARDAMHGVGQLELRLECTDQQPVECASCHNTLRGDYVVLSVRDSGDGMTAEVRDHLFEPFFTTKDVGEGTGLGLSVAHGIMHDHQGHIRVDSEPGQGTVFYLLFPALQNDTADAGVQGEPAVVGSSDDLTANKAHEAMPPATKKHLLVVDDELALLEFLRVWLERAGYEVQAFEESQAALDYFHAHADTVDMLITDQTMPGLTGKELIQKVHALRPCVPTILCSGYSGQGDAESGIGYFAEKPFDRKQLLEAIILLLSEAEAE
jgi:CheY-like chemotaxis protein